MDEHPEENNSVNDTLTVEQAFCHDITNTMGGIMGFATLISEFGNADAKLFAGKILALAEKLLQDVQDHSELAMAECHTLQVDPQATTPFEVIEEVRRNFEAHEAARGRQLRIKNAPKIDRITTHGTLLRRVLINMVKNAFEASGPADPVKLWYENRNGAPTFLVHNTGRIPDHIARHIFQRCFSTKGDGRGIGTYSMKLLGERYLKATVGFATNETQGTTFYIMLPPEASVAPAKYAPIPAYGG